MQDHYLTGLFDPKSIAVIGASERQSAAGSFLWNSVNSSGFKGKAYAVNPHYQQIGDVPCYANVTEIQQPIDLALIITPMPTVRSILQECADCNIRHAIIMTGGFNKDGYTTRHADDELVAYAKSLGIRILGPHSPGIIRPSQNLNTTFYRNTIKPGRLALISHSGAMSSAVLDWAENTGVGFSSVITTGAEADVDLAEILDYLIADYRTTSILLYLEHLGSSRSFMSALRAAARIKPIVVMKSSQDSAAYCDSISRTGDTHSVDDVFDAALDRAGVVRVYSFSNLFAAAKILSSNVRTRGERLGIISNGMGPASMAADRLSHLGLPLASLGPDLLDKFDQFMPDYWLRSNPVIMSWDNAVDGFQKAIEEMRGSQTLDAILVILTPDPRFDMEAVSTQVITAAKKSRKPILTCWMGDVQVAASRKLFRDANIPTFRTPEAAVDAFSFICAYLRNQKLLQQVPYTLSKNIQPDLARAKSITQTALDKNIRVLDQQSSLELLQAFHIDTPQAITVNSKEDACKAAETIGFPIAMKISSPNIAYKSDVGGVKLNIPDSQTTAEEYDRMLERVHALKPDIELDGIVIEEMHQRPHARELMVNVINDPIFGPVITLGLGGTKATVFGDRAVALPPLNRYLADDLINRTQASRLLTSFRNLPAIDRSALRKVLLRVSEMVCELPELLELRINPLIVDEKGAVAADVYAVIQKSNADVNTYRHMAIHPYPLHLTRCLELKGGITVEVRPMRPEDAQEEQEFVRHEMSKEAKYFRFMHALNELTPEMLSKMTQIDYDREMALVATILDEEGHEKIIGVSRYGINPDKESCEFAVAIGDKWQGIGLASTLMKLLIEHAKSKQLKIMEGTVLFNNGPMAKLMESLGFKGKRNIDDPEIIDFTYPLQ